MLTLANLKPKDIILLTRLLRSHRAEKEYENLVKQTRLLIKEANRLEAAKNKPLNDFFKKTFYGEKQLHSS